MPNEIPVWSSDVNISIPQPSKHDVRIKMYGFGFTVFGITHDLTEAEFDFFRSPTYTPETPVGDVVFDDSDVD